MGSWMNNDGLYIQYGTTKSTPNVAGEYVTTGALREVEMKIDLTALGTSPVIISDTTIFPKSCRIEEVEVVTHTAATSTGAAVLNIGFQALDRSTEVDYDGLVAALALTSIDLAGEKTVIRVGSTSAGALLGTALSNPAYLTADYDTDNYDTGVIYVRVRFYA